VEELRIYLDLVQELGDPFTAFERGWDRGDDPAPPPSPPVATAPRAARRRYLPPSLPGDDYGFPG